MINFLGLSGRTAALIRGKQIAYMIYGSTYHDVNSGMIGTNPISIIIRNENVGVAKTHKKAGKLVGYDVCDMPAGDAFYGKFLPLQKYCHEVYDFYIVNNDTCASRFREHTDKPIYVIPHHTVNFERIQNPVAQRVKKVGYVGLSEQLSRSEEIKKFCNEHGAEFVNVHPGSREECVRVFCSLDIGINYLDESSHSSNLLDVVKVFKPNTKLSNFQSFGIPTISVSNDSYAQFGKDAFIKVDRFEELLHNLRELILNEEVRRSLSERAYTVGDELNIDFVTKKYTDLATEILRGNSR